MLWHIYHGALIALFFCLVGMILNEPSNKRAVARDIVITVLPAGSVHELPIVRVDYLVIRVDYLVKR